MFKIEDERHTEPHAGELRRLAHLPWDKWPNLAPCANWATCGRTYEVVEYDDSTQPWRELRRLPALGIDAQGVRWLSVEIEKLSAQ